MKFYKISWNFMKYGLLRLLCNLAGPYGALWVPMRPDEARWNPMALPRRTRHRAFFLGPILKCTIWPYLSRLSPCLWPACACDARAGAKQVKKQWRKSRKGVNKDSKIETQGGPGGSPRGDAHAGRPRRGVRFVGCLAQNARFRLVRAYSTVVFAHGLRRRTPQHQKDHHNTVGKVKNWWIFGRNFDARKSIGGIYFQAFCEGCFNIAFVNWENSWKAFCVLLKNTRNEQI